jgi:hypothetical protein
MAGTVYTVSGNVREQLGVEQAVELGNIDTTALALVVANIDAIKKVAANLGGFDNLDALVASAQSSATTAQVAQTLAVAAETAAVASAAGIDAKVQLADDWARKTGAPVEGADLSSKASASAAAGSAADAQGFADTANFASSNAAGSAATADQIVNGPTGQEVTPGHFTMSTYVDQILGVVNQAPVLAGRFINTAGVAGVETINFAATDFYNTVEIRRAAGHDVKLKCVQGLYTGPPPGGTDRSYAWVQVINSGAGSVTVEGPSAPGGGTVTTVFPPKRIVYKEADFRVTSPGAPAPGLPRKLPTTAVPSGTDRVVTIVTISSFWSGTGHAVPVTSGQIVGLTKQQSAGDGTVSNAAPMLCEIWTGTLPNAAGGGAGPALADLDVTGTANGFLARLVIIAVVHQDSSGFEQAGCAVRAGSTTTATRVITPTQAQSANWVVAAFQGNTTAPVVITGTPSAANAEDFTANGIGQPGTTANDHAWSVMNDGSVNAAAYTYTATASVASQAVMAGITLKPRTVTTVTSGNDGLITDQTKPFTIAPSQQGFILAASDGTDWYADK